MKLTIQSKITLLAIFIASITLIMSIEIYMLYKNLDSDESDALVNSKKYINYLTISLFIGASVLGVVFIQFYRYIKNSISKALTTVDKISQGNLNLQIENLSDDEIGRLLSRLKMMTEKLKNIVSVVITSSESIANASLEMSRSSQVMSEGASDQASSAEEVSSSMEEMAANIEENTANARETEGLSTKGAASLADSNEMVKRTLESMKTITDKISIIGEIARQTQSSCT